MEEQNLKKEENGYFPLFMKMKGKRVTIIGGGNIALRRVKALLPTKAVIVVIAPEYKEELGELARNREIRLKCGKYRKGLLYGSDFVLSATNDEAVERQVYEDCKAERIFVNIASKKEWCDFYFPAIIRKEPIIVGVTADGANHVLVKETAGKIRKLLSES